MRRVDASNEAPAEACSSSHTTLALPDWTAYLALLVWACILFACTMRFLIIFSSLG